MNLIKNFISEDLIYALGWTMIHSLWQGLLIAFFLLIALYLLQDKSAKLRYEIAGLSLFSLFISSICTFIFFYENISHGPVELTMLQDVGKHINNPGIPLEYYSQSAAHYFNQHLPLIVTIWLLGVAFFLLRLLGGLVFIQKLKHQKNSPLAPFWQAKMKNLLSKIPVKRKVKLLESSLVNVPMVIGYLKPVLLMPVGAINNLSTAEVEAILAHELAHVVRNDYLINIFFSFIEVLFYYHPAVWIISAHIRSERENCADDIAIKLCGNSLTYARALVSLEEMNPNIPIFAMPFSGPKNQLLQRIQRILNQPQNRTNILEKLTATSLLLLAVLLLSFSSGKSTQESTIDKTIIEETIKTTLSDLDTKVETIVSGELEKILPATIKIRKDTVPDPIKKNKKQRIFRKDDNGEIEVELLENKITELKIDGKLIPEEDYPSYENQVADLLENLPPPPPAPPIPPSPTAMPNLPAPPAPPTGIDAGAIPAPPAPPAPPAAPRMNKNIKVITSAKDDNGHTVIMIDGDAQPMEISINGEETIFIDGQALKTGDSIIIIEHGEDAYVQSYDIRGSWTNELEEEIEALQKSMQDLDEVQREELQSRIEEMRVLQEEQRQLAIEHREAAKERYGEAADLRREAADRYREMADLQRAEADIQRAEADLQREEALAHMEEAREEALAHIEEAKAHAEEAREAAREGAIHHKKHDPLIEQLDRDGFINKNEHYSIQFNGKRLKVNGERMSDAMHQEYVELLGKEIGAKFNISIIKY